MSVHRALAYLFHNPRYFRLYFTGRPEKVLEEITGTPRERYAELSREFSESDVVAQLRERTARVTGETFHLHRDHLFLYALTRVIRPRHILETGVFDGYFSACFLAGLRDNAGLDRHEGSLVSIDLPAYTPIEESTGQIARARLPEDCEPGWVIPDDLRGRWTLQLGDSRALRPGLLEQIEPLSLFFHDSLHTDDHMTFEYQAAWPYLAKGAYLLSHDIHWNPAFRRFVKQHRECESAFHGFGLLRKS
ncbi:MAG: class I SAM-dependent methyltransferase [Myxococcota bacterium]